LAENGPTSGFYLLQTDPESDATIYYSGDLTIRSDISDVPEPGTIILEVIKGTVLLVEIGGTQCCLP